jgi:hypothetical protein
VKPTTSQKLSVSSVLGTTQPKTNFRSERSYF